jgi:hypothetical protein
LRSGSRGSKTSCTSGSRSCWRRSRSGCSSIGIALARAVASGELAARVATLLDRLLLILMVVEILYTVQVSLREHTLVPEPFLVVGLIAGIRRILVLTAEFSKMIDEGGDTFRNGMLELGVLTAMVLVLVGALAMLRRRVVPSSS